MKEHSKSLEDIKTLIINLDQKLDRRVDALDQRIDSRGDVLNQRINHLDHKIQNTFSGS